MLEQDKNSKVYEQVIEEIKNQIKTGKLKKGDKLPSERDMVELFSVSRTSVREAMRALEVIGLIERKQGAGNYIKTNFDDSLFEPISVMFMLQKNSLDDIVELREILESYCIKLAVRNIYESEIETISEIMEEMYQAKNEEENLALDIKLHYLLIKASKNILLINIISVISQIMDESIKEFRKKILYEENNRAKLLSIHEKLVNAMKEHDTVKAVDAIEEHFKLIRKYYK
ncbi:FadR/GntR family transcriptional regulator [Clostridium butyricum]|uniref:FadR/GntR family transcriptional regulator n=1 Tax=Clostridium butyricum TaxID=1492 RepID=UPI0022DF21DC|nr:FadR/GntR family transcriptional regulator [Clostridium butyricum]